MTGILIQTILTSAKSGTRFRKIVNDNDTIEYVIENLGDCGGYDEGSGSLVPSAQGDNSMSVDPYGARGRRSLDNCALVPHQANSLGSVVPKSIHITVKKQPEISGFNRKLRRSNHDKVRKDKTILKEGVGKSKINSQKVYENVVPNISYRGLTRSATSSFPPPTQLHEATLQLPAEPTGALCQNKIEIDHFYGTDSDEDLTYGLKISTKVPEILNKSLFVDSDSDSDEGDDLTTKTKQNTISPYHSIEKGDVLTESSTCVNVPNNSPNFKGSSSELSDRKTAREAALNKETALTEEARKSLSIYKRKDAVCWCEACNDDTTEQTNCFHCGGLSYCMLSCKRCAYVKYCSETCRAADLESHDEKCDAKGTDVGLLAEIIQVVQHTKFYLLTIQRINQMKQDVAILLNIYEHEYSTEELKAELNRALESNDQTIIIIESARLGEDTARWIAYGNRLHETAVLSGVGCLVGGLFWPNQGIVFLLLGLTSVVCAGVYAVSWQFDPCCKYQVEYDHMPVPKTPLLSLTTTTPVVLVRKDDYRKTVLQSILAIAAGSFCFYKIYTWHS